MKITDSDYISDKIAETYYSINIDNGNSIKKIFSKIKYKNNTQKLILNLILNNYKIAKQNKTPLCQDTGTPIIFIETSNKNIFDNNFEKILTRKIAKISKEKGLRFSIVDNPISKNRKILKNKPIVHYIFSNRKNIRIIVIAKGGGSENLSTLLMLSPTLSQNEIIERIIEIVKNAASKGCPPYILGIAIGGDSETAMLNAKMALSGYFSHNKNNEEKGIAKEITKKGNKLNIGIHGLGFGPTIIDSRVKILPTHIASLPVAITFQCFQERVKEIII